MREKDKLTRGLTSNWPLGSAHHPPPVLPARIAALFIAHCFATFLNFISIKRDSPNAKWYEKSRLHYNDNIPCEIRKEKKNIHIFQLDTLYGKQSFKNVWTENGSYKILWKVLDNLFNV